MTEEGKKSGVLKPLLQLFLCLAILAVGALAAWKLILARDEPAIEKKPDLGPLVTVHTVEAKDVDVEVRGFGTVEPKLQVDLVPEVSGKIISIHPSLVDGGFFLKDEILAEVDPTDYKLALDRASAAVERARVALDLEKAEAEVARVEWESMNPDTEPPSPLVLRIPQIRRAEADLKAAEAEVRNAEIDLRRTQISLPFNGRILSERVDIGQLVSKGQAIATAYGTDVVEVRIPLEDGELKWFELPLTSGKISPANGNPDRLGAPARVVSAFAGGVHQWQGQAVRTAGRVDPKSRMVTVVVEVKQPFDLANGRPPLVPGMFVEVFIQGRTMPQVFPVPRYALREGNVLWIARDGRLVFQPVQSVERMDRKFAYLSDDLENGAQVVISSMDTVTNGMQIRTAPGASTAGERPPESLIENSTTLLKP